MTPGMRLQLEGHKLLVSDASRTRWQLTPRGESVVVALAKRLPPPSEQELKAAESRLSAILAAVAAELGPLE